MSDYGMRNLAAEGLDEDDSPDSLDGEFDEYEDERRAARGTSECDGLCHPQCDWCLVAHSCPDDCAGGPCPCPYESLDPSLGHERAFELGRLDAQDKTKRRRLEPFIRRRSYLQGYESWIRRNDRRKRARCVTLEAMFNSVDIGF
jgi:hypothetical protein